MEANVENGPPCALQTCLQRDFLPFQCTGCSQKYCFEHSNPTAHDCQGSSITIIVCPICEQSLKAAPGVDANVLWMDHSDTTCPGSRRGKQKCPVCHIMLSMVNTFHCRLCENDFCTKHRAPENHPCGGSFGNQSNPDARRQETIAPSGGRVSQPEILDMKEDDNTQFDDISFGLPSRVDFDDDYAQRDALLEDKKRGKLAKVMLALANLCNFKSRRSRGISRQRPPQFPEIGNRTMA